jgi:ribosomal protein S26
MADFDDDREEAPPMEEKDYTLIFCRRIRPAATATATATADTTTTATATDAAPGAVAEVKEVLLGMKKRVCVMCSVLCTVVCLRFRQWTKQLVIATLRYIFFTHTHI